jgi:hypothetical protein
MDLKEVEEEVIRQTVGVDGFLVQLHSRAVFDEDKYQSLKASLRTYDRLLGDAEVVNRYVANCLVQLQAGLLDAHAKLEAHNHPNQSRAGDAVAEIWDIVVRLLTPPQLRSEKGTSE